MTKKEREQIHDRLTYEMMENVNRHADVQKMIQEKNKESSDMVKITVAFCAGCLVTLALSNFIMMI